VQLTATAEAGWHFVGWSGDATGNANPLGLLVDAAKNVTASFAINSYSLSVNVIGSGAVATSPEQASYEHGTSVELTATADPGWAFAGWSGGASGNANPLTLVIDGDKTVTATFVDAVAPTVQLLAPNTSADVMVVGVVQPITWSAADNVGVTAIDLLLSRTGEDGPYEVVASGVPNTGSYDWVVTGPATANGVLRVIASDAAANTAADASDQPLAIVEGTVAVESPVLRFALLPVVPSPSVSSAKLRFELPREARVDLTIVDVRGREVASLVHGTLPAGRHAAAWNGQAASGRAPAGVYFAKYAAGGIRAVRRILLLP
jgi:hypothetical protein